MSEKQEPAGNEQARRWRLILGGAKDESEAAEEGGGGGGESLGPADQAMDEALSLLYGDQRGASLADSRPDIARWLGDIRQYFPAPVVQMMQRDAWQKRGLRRFLDHPEILAGIEPDIKLVADILSLQRVLPLQTRASARQVVAQVVREVQARLSFPLQQAVRGALHRAQRTRRPRHLDVHWHQTIRANLKHYQPAQKTIIPETVIGFNRKRHSLRDVMLCVDTSGSMATSVVYAGIYAAVMASVAALTTRVVLFDTKVVDMTDQAGDPVDLLFGIRLGGGTNIGRALTYCEQMITRPRETILVLISDLFEGGSREELLQVVNRLLDQGVQIIVLLALNDDGAPRFDRQLAQTLADLEVTAFACTPAQFPDLMAAAIDRRDLRAWAATQGIVTAA